MRNTRYTIPTISALGALVVAGCYKPTGEPPAEDPPAEEPPAEDPPAEEPPADDPPVDEIPDPLVGDWELTQRNYDGYLLEYPVQYTESSGATVITGGATFSVEGPSNIWRTYTYTYNDGRPPESLTYIYQVGVVERNMGSWSIVADFHGYAFVGTCVAQQDTLLCSGILDGSSLSLVFTRAAEEMAP